MAGIKLFLSGASVELAPYRAALKKALVGPSLELKEQTDFINLGGDTLEARPCPKF